jgi:hypothetical protein
MTINNKLEKLKQTQIQTPDHKTKFYPRVINNTNITFTKGELSILRQGLQYNINHKPKHWIQTLALEAETAINYLPTVEQDHVRWQVAKTINKFYKQNPKSANSHNHNERKLIKRKINYMLTKLESHVQINVTQLSLYTTMTMTKKSRILSPQANSTC